MSIEHAGVQRQEMDSCVQAKKVPQERRLEGVARTSAQKPRVPGQGVQAWSGASPESLPKEEKG